MRKGARWTKIKKQLKTFICTKLKDRVDFIIAVYRKAHDQTGRICITVDGKEVFSMCTITAEIEDYKTYRKLRDEFNESKENRDIWEISQQEINTRGIFGEYEFYKMLEEYFDSDVSHCLNSTNILLNIFGLLDRRIGKRSLKKFSEVVKDKNEIVQYFFNLRCNVEEMNFNNDSGN
ncbi:hypothetical protein OW763_14465 [Clostridium aestuarii]|uniref:DUF4304 domain-containing protein n=1 Tax=Clostridium aestuarii TaxID=338193 RepID=A0ABT4D2R5_9CLOT|nr:hypothetical protein [Clostridium aestuarii]MCY6485535.1 hypothetical protein [Clostridium aestuarii]